MGPARAETLISAEGPTAFASHPHEDLLVLVGCAQFILCLLCSADRFSSAQPVTTKWRTRCPQAPVTFNVLPTVMVPLIFSRAPVKVPRVFLARFGNVLKTVLYLDFLPLRGHC